MNVYVVYIVPADQYVSPKFAARVASVFSSKIEGMKFMRAAQRVCGNQYDYVEHEPDEKCVHVFSVDMFKRGNHIASLLMSEHQLKGSPLAALAEQAE